LAFVLTGFGFAIHNYTSLSSLTVARRVGRRVGLC
jgi:hypothetical protein